MKKINTVLFTLAFALNALLIKSQTPGTTCAGALTISPTSTISNINQNTNDGWFLFTPATGTTEITIENIGGTNNKKIRKVELSTGICSGLVLISTDSISSPADSVLNLIAYSTVPGINFYLKTIREDITNPMDPYITAYFNLGLLQIGDPSCKVRALPCALGSVGPNCEMVCNGSFETQSLTVTYHSQLNNANGWTSPTWGTPDLFSTTATLANVTIPCARGWGFQNALNLGSGANAFAGIYTGWNATGPNWAEYIQTELNTPMTTNIAYEVSFWVSRADFENWDNDRLDVYLSKTLTCANPSYATMNSIPSGPIPVYTETNPNVLNDATTWREIKFIYCASGSEQYLMIGNHIGSLGTYVPSTPTVVGTCTMDPNSKIVGSPVYSYDFPYIFIDEVSIKEINFNLSFSPNNQCPNSQTNFFMNGCPTPTSTSYFNWNFGDGSPTVISGTYTPHTYTLAGTYTVTVTYNVPIVAASSSCSLSYTTVVTVIPPPVIFASASPTTICPGNSSTLTASGVSTYTWNPGNIVGNSIVVTPSVSTVYSVTGTSSVDCINSQTVLVNVAPVPNLTVTPSVPYLCSSAAGTAISFTVSGANTYTWVAVGSLAASNSSVVTDFPFSTTSYTVFGTNLAGCTNSVVFTFSIIPCCPSCTSNAPLSIAVTTVITNKSLCVNTDLTIAPGAAVTFSNCELKFMPGVKLIVDNSAVLTIDKSHLYACQTMWQGIVIKDAITNGPGTGQVNLLNNFLIEDALVAVDIPGHLTTALPGTLQILSSNQGVFNKNNVGIRISNYTYSTTPSTQYRFVIQNTIFTSRLIAYNTFTPFIPTSAQTANVKATWANPLLPLGSPYVSNTYTPTTTLLGTFPQAGIVLQNVGTTLNPTATPTYYEIKIGQNGPPNINVFDNLVVGIDASSSNFTSVNNVFQNTHTVTIGSPPTPAGGIGINAIAARSQNNRIRVISGTPVGSFINQFFDCSRAVFTNNYFEHQINYCDVRSTQVLPPSRLPLPQGKYGFYMTTNRFKKVDVSDNKLYNVESAITFNANYGFVTLPPVISSANGQYSGQINIDRNTIQPHLPTFTITTQYVENAIYCANVIPPNPAVKIAGTTVNHNSNQISNVNRGIYSANWAAKNVLTNSNCITLLDDPFIPATPQFGVNYSNNLNSASFGNSIFNNAVTGPSAVFTNTLMHSIYESMSTNLNVRCNNVKQTYSGIEFDGVPSNPALFLNNVMQSHKYGFVLNNAAVTGTLGSPTLPVDDQWLGLWPAGVFKTFVAGFADATFSPIHVRQIPSQYNPNGSGGFGTGSTILNIYVNPGTIIYASGPLTSCPSGPCSGGGSGSPPASSISASDVQTMEQIAMDQITFSVNINESKFIGKNHLYHILKTDPSIKASSPILQNFYSINQPNTFGKLSNIEDDLSAGNIAIAQANLSAFTPTNNIENNYKTYYGLYIKNLIDSIGFNSSDSTTLSNLAFLCPNIDGAVVYQARALYNSVYKTVKFFNDNCAPQNNRFTKGFSGSEIETNGNFNVIIFPNPSNGVINISPFGILEGELHISVKDVTGKNIYNNTLPVSNGNSSFILDAKSGIYFVDVLEPRTGQKVITKIIIQK